MQAAILSIFYRKKTQKRIKTIHLYRSVKRGAGKNETNHPHKHQFSTRIYEPKHFHKTKLLILIEGEENIHKTQKNTHTRHIFLKANARVKIFPNSSA